MKHINEIRGFTLIEILVAMGLGLFILGVLYNVFLTGEKTYDQQEQMAEMQQNARVAMDMMVNEIRMAGFDPVNTPSLGKIVSAEADSLRFTKNITRTNPPHEPDADILDPDEDVTYFLATTHDGASTLSRTARERLSDTSASGLRTHAVAENIDTLAFTYLKEDGTAAATTDEIRQIRVSITARTGKPDPLYTDPGHGDHYHRYILTSTIFLRNLKLRDE